MLLAIDIGNSHVKLGAFRGDDMVMVASTSTDDRRTADEYACLFQNILFLRDIQASAISGAILCSVVPAMTSMITEAVRLLCGQDALNVSSGIKTGLRIRHDAPRSLGSDLVANAVWARELGRLPCVVVDLGTVTAFLALDADGALVGTAIAAGIQASLNALKQCAAQLPAVQAEDPPHGILGHNTAEAIKAGAVYGAAAMVDGMVDRFALALGASPAVLLTGGSANIIAPHLHTSYYDTPYATLHGLASLWRKNRG